MTIVTVPSLTPRYPITLVGEDTKTLVSEKFSDAKGYAGDAITAANKYLDILSAIFTSAAMPETDIDYGFQDVSLDTDIESKRPEAPSGGQLTPTPITPPSLGTIPGVSIPSIVVPSSDFGALETDFSFSEPVYASQLAEDVKAALISYIANGGTGLGAAVEAALWARALARQELDNERVYDEALNYFAARGFTIPPGALTGKLAEAVAEQTRATAQMNYEIMIEQARLAQANTHHVLTVSVQLEGVEKEFADKVANRAFESARSACEIVINTYNAKIAAYATELEKGKTEAVVADMKVKAQIAQGDQAVKVYAADIDKYKTDVAQELGIIESVAKVYGYKVAGYEADAKVAIGVLDAQVEAFKGRLIQANNQTQLTLKEAELVLQSYIAALALQEESTRGAAGIAAQIAASALNSVNASANLGYTIGKSQSESTGHATGISRSASLGEAHHYTHEA